MQWEIPRAEAAFVTDHPPQELDRASIKAAAVVPIRAEREAPKREHHNGRANGREWREGVHAWIHSPLIAGTSADHDRPGRVQRLRVELVSEGAPSLADADVEVGPVSGQESKGAITDQEVTGVGHGTMQDETIAGRATRRHSARGRVLDQTLTTHATP